MQDQRPSSISEHLMSLSEHSEFAYPAERLIRKQFAKSAEDKFSHTDATIDKVERHFDQACEVLYAIYAGAQQKRDSGDVELWKHQDRLINGSALDSQFSFNADELRLATLEYLNQPLRSQYLDFVLIDALAACETHEFWRYANAEKGLPRELHRPGAVQVFFQSVVWIVGVLGAVLAGIHFLVPGWLPISILVALSLGSILLLLMLVLSIAYASENGKERKRNQKLIVQMLDAYHSIPRGPPISHREMRRKFQTTGDVGVSWPSSIFALLDDIADR